MFDVIAPRHGGVLALEADSLIEKTARGHYLSSGGKLTEEKTPGYEDHKIKEFVEPGNTLFWRHSKKGQLAPRGAWGSWSFAMPARHLGQNRYRPLQSPGQDDIDFEEEVIIAASGWGGTPPVGTDAIILATTEHGNHQKIAFSIGGGGGGGSPLISHWRGNRPPQYSTHVADIRGDSPDPERHAGLDTIFKVQEWIPPCSTATGSNFKRQFTIALNGAWAPEGQGGLHVAFKDRDALFSYMASGPLEPSFAGKHLLGRTADGPLLAGAITTKAYFKGSKMPFVAPLAFEEEIYPPVINGEVPYEVHRQYDPTRKHDFLCGQRDGLWREFVKLPLGETPPCTPTKDYSSSSRSFAESTRVFFYKKVQSTGIYFQPRAQMVKGRP